MKRLYLKRGGISLLVKVSESPNGIDVGTKYISVYEDKDKDSKFHPKLLFSIMDGGFKSFKLILGDGISELPAYMILSAAEIIDNFEQYYNNLNQ